MASHNELRVWQIETPRGDRLAFPERNLLTECKVYYAAEAPARRNGTQWTSAQRTGVTIDLPERREGQRV